MTNWLTCYCYSSWDLPAVPCSTGTTYHPVVTNAVNSRPTLPLPSFQLCSGSYLHSLASSGCASMSVVHEPKPFTPVAVGTAEATSKTRSTPPIRTARGSWIVWDGHAKMDTCRRFKQSPCSISVLFCILSALQWKFPRYDEAVTWRALILWWDVKLALRYPRYC